LSRNASSSFLVALHKRSVLVAQEKEEEEKKDTTLIAVQKKNGSKIKNKIMNAHFL